MTDLKVTKEIHAEVREALKTKRIMTIAKEFGISRKTVSRIRKGGRNYSGYKRALKDDHISLQSAFAPTSLPAPATTLLKKKSLLERIGLRF